MLRDPARKKDSSVHQVTAKLMKLMEINGVGQLTAAKFLKNYAAEKAHLPEMSRWELIAFLSGTSNEGYVPSSGSLVGILKQLHDEMSAGLADATKGGIFNDIPSRSKEAMVQKLLDKEIARNWRAFYRLAKANAKKVAQRAKVKQMRKAANKSKKLRQKKKEIYYKTVWGWLRRT